MATAYTPGLTVTRRTTHRVRRLLPVAGDVLVKKGDTVSALDIVAETFMPGDVTPVNIANMLALPPGDVPECMLKQEGDAVEEGEPIAQTKGIFGFFKKACKSKATGTVETISPITGQVMIRGEQEPRSVIDDSITNEGRVVPQHVAQVA